jgi:hypothetical protein
MMFNRPIAPYIVNQPWGNYDPKTYHQFGFDRHNGVDLALAPDKKIVAPFAGTIARRGFQPQGGGIFGSLISEVLEFQAFANTTPDGMNVPFHAGRYRTMFDFLHCEKILVSEGQKVQAGEVIAIGDNTGLSTGPHCHTQWRRVNWDGKTIQFVDINGANNSFDPTPFFGKRRFGRDLRFGMLRDMDVTFLQDVLKRDGCLDPAIPSTGNYLDKTRLAVYAFQRKHAVDSVPNLLALNGKVVGPKTREALDALGA